MNRTALASFTERWMPWTPTEKSTDAASSVVTDADRKVLLIAEIANAHQGRPADAMKLVEAAAGADCDAVKLQKYYAAEMLAPGHSMMSTFSRWEWDQPVWRELIESAQAAGLKVFVDVFGVRAYESLRDVPPVDGLKIHAADINNVPLLKLLRDTAFPLLIGTGGCSDLDIYQAISGVGQPERIVLMHGYQGFPCPLEDTALRRIPHLLETFGVAVGLSDHLDADDCFVQVGPLLAIPLGVCCIEKHLTLDRAAGGVDHESSLNPEEMRQLVQTMRQTEVALGSAELPASVSEDGYRRRFKKVLITSRPISRGEIVTTSDVALRMAENPVRHSLSQADAVGTRALRDIPKGELLSAGDLDVATGLCLVARLKSERLPRKALVEIEGKPALVHLIERAKLCRSVERTVLCTSTHPEDAPLVSLARQCGIDAYAGSPEQPLERLIACAEMYGWRYVVRATADNIFLDPELLEQAVALATEQNLDYVSMRSVPVGAHCEVFSTFALRVVQQHAQAPYTTEYLTWFVADNPNFREMDLPVPEDLQRKYHLTLDTPEDLENISQVVGMLSEAPQPYTLRDLIRVVESDPELERRCTGLYRPSAQPAPVTFDFRVLIPE